jgi:hypothetical protein|tara:strand:+ start:135 stop:773 length:639 start_codon:yes stop_codon:yes gene_type:complete
MIDLKELTAKFEKNMVIEGSNPKPNSKFLAVFKKYGFKMELKKVGSDVYYYIKDHPKFDVTKAGLAGNLGPNHWGDGELVSLVDKKVRGQNQEFKDPKELIKFLDQRFKTLYKTQSDAGKGFSLEVHQDFKYDNNNNFIGQYSVNGKKKKTTDESGGDLLRDISKVMKVNANKFEDWFSKKFKFDIGRLEHMEISGEPGKPNTWSGEATELN